MMDVLDDMTRRGYGEIFSGEPGGIRGSRSGLLHRASDLEIVEIERFEGISDPEDESIVLALRCRAHGCRGTYVVPYGKDMSSVDAEFIRSMPDVRRT